MRSLDELAQEGARRMIAEALELEADNASEKLRHLRDENGHALVVRNGKAHPRKISLGAGSIEIQAPRVDDRRPDHRFTSKILPLCWPKMNIRSKISRSGWIILLGYSG